MSLLLHNFVMNYEIIMYKHIQRMHVVCTLMYCTMYTFVKNVLFTLLIVQSIMARVTKVSCNIYFLPLKAKHSYSGVGLLFIEDACK